MDMYLMCWVKMQLWKNLLNSSLLKTTRMIHNCKGYVMLKHEGKIMVLKHLFPNTLHDVHTVRLVTITNHTADHLYKFTY